MSFAEIKKAVNSDLNVPLNELIIEKAEETKGVKIFAPQGTYTTEKTWLDISGKGYLINLLAYMNPHNNTRCKLEVEVDGVKKININITTSTDSSAIVRFALSPFDGILYRDGNIDIRGVVSNVGNIDILDKGSTNAVLRTSYNFYSISENINVSKSSISNKQYYGMFYDGYGIRFEKSLKITFLSGYESNYKYFSGAYILD